MNRFHRWCKRTAVAACGLFVVCYGLSLWNKHDFCRGWADHFEQRAVEAQRLQRRAVADGRSDDAAELAETAVRLAVVAEKYRRVAFNPLRPYPSKPLVTDAELASAIAVR